MANVIWFLASDEASFITGSILVADGGMRNYAEPQKPFEKIELRVRRVVDRNIGGTNELKNINEHIEEIFQQIIPKQPQLGFFHWLLLSLCVSVLYGLVVWQDGRMPAVLPKDNLYTFSEERARLFLEQITSLGPRPTGSNALEVQAVQFLTGKITSLKQIVDRNGINRLELDIQRPSSCFNMRFFTNCFHKVTNVAVRILFLCNYDRCAGSVSSFENLFGNDIVFLFNGAEESYLQASQGFISQHKWRHSLRAFINLEGAGSGGREMLFQAGPGDSWLLKTYLDNVPYPRASIIAQEVFQSNLVPSDTDFRNFRDFGRISGLDIAYVKNGWVYHTEFDQTRLIHKGAIQRNGENVLSLIKALISSPYLQQPANFDEGKKWIFFEIFGFAIYYGFMKGTLANLTASLSVLIMIAYRIRSQLYTSKDVLTAFAHHSLALLGMAVTALMLYAVVYLLNLSMFWYATPWLVLPFYILPMVSTGLWVHSSIVHKKYSGINAEIFHYDTMLAIWAAILFLATAAGIGSAFYFLIFLVFPMLRDPMIYLLGKMQVLNVVTPKTVFYTQFACLLPVILFANYAVYLVFSFFIPIMGRIGNNISPELIILPLCLIIASTVVLFTANLIYVSRRLHFLIKCCVALCLLAIAIIITTRLGDPYKYSEDSPRLRRLLAAHSKRIVYDFGGKINSTATGLFIQTMDYRGITDLPEHTFLQGTDKPDCSNTQDDYCQLPYYHPNFKYMKPEYSRWVPLPSSPQITKPISVHMLSRVQPVDTQLNISLVVRGGADRMALHVSPLQGYTLKEWSITKNDSILSEPKNTHYVNMNSGHEHPQETNIWILLENFAVVSHYVHGAEQNSETLQQLKSLIHSRRETPHHAVGFWKWAITMTGMTSEIVVHFF
uniref:FXNA-like protease n=1 Tax=Ditylenchus dipsaci TaxID=166011 RepID=A0A915EM45_9BILA